LGLPAPGQSLHRRGGFDNSHGEKVVQAGRSINKIVEGRRSSKSVGKNS
jgi:hypothetical protein